MSQPYRLKMGFIGTVRKSKTEPTLREVPAEQIEYGEYVWVRNAASASLVRHFPERGLNQAARAGRYAGGFVQVPFEDITTGLAERCL